MGRTKDFIIRHISWEIDLAIERYQFEQLEKTGERPTKQAITLNALEIGLKELGIWKGKE